jgi:inorganic pyrophosphatase
MCTESITPMTLVRCFPIGALKMIDGNETDEKIIALPFGDPTYANFRDICDLPDHVFAEMKHFFTVYKALENKETYVNEIVGREGAIEIINKALESYIDIFCRGE